VTTLTSAQALSHSRVRVVFSGAVQAFGVEGVALSPTVSAPSVVVFEVELEAGGGAAVLGVAPGLGTGATYEALAALVADAGGVPVSGSATFAAPTEDEDEALGGALEVLTGALGEQVEALVGEPTTRTLAVWDGGEVLFVESALGFPDTGAVFVGDGRLLAYEGVDPSGAALLSVYEWPSRGEPIPDGALVSLLPARVGPITKDDSPYQPSSAERGRRQTLITQARPGEDLDRLAAFYGLPRPAEWDVGAWRAATLASAQQPRGAFGQVWDFLEGATSDEQAAYPDVRLYPADPSAVTSLGGTFGAEMAQRFVRIEFLPASALPLHPRMPSQVWPRVSRVFFALGPRAGDAAVLELVPVATSYFEAARWDVGANAVDGLYPEARLWVLPFGITRDDACRFDVGLSGEGAVPPSYLLEPAGVNRAAYVPDPPPLGSILMADPVTPASDVEGVHPIYFDGEGGDVLEGPLRALLAAGVLPTVERS
jgi:hypothetical protein